LFQNSHFPKDLPHTEDRDDVFHAVFKQARHLHLATFDHIEIVARRFLFENHLSRSQGLSVYMPRYQGGSGGIETRKNGQLQSRIS
jgi:hypothetical protein